MQPFLELRGVPAARHQDEHTALLETELRWNVDERWALLGFVGDAEAHGPVRGTRCSAWR